MKIWTRLSPSTKGSEGAAGRGRKLAPRGQSDAGLVLGGFGALDVRPGGPLERLKAWGRAHPFWLIVLLPTLIAASYFWLIAAPQYVSESRFVVRSRTQGGISLLSDALNSAGFRSAPEDAIMVRDFIASHDAVQELRRQMDLVAMFRRPEADLWARHWYNDPPAERLLSFYRGMVTAAIDTSSGIATLQVRSFRPVDSLQINEALLKMSEHLVNGLNARIQQDTIAAARREVARAEERVTGATEAISSFRERERQLDPTRSAGIAVENIGRLQATLAQTRSELQTLQGYARNNNPQVQVLQNRIQALQTQIDEERRRTSSGNNEGFTQQVAAYERLRLELEFAGRQLTTATATLESALNSTLRQQIFLQRVVEPNLAEQNLYPKRFTSVLYVFIGLSVIYGLGWLLIAGVKEHAA